MEPNEDPGVSTPVVDEVSEEVATDEVVADEVVADEADASPNVAPEEEKTEE